jgi:tetratricopeptide (TPR) repeat protein
MQLRISFLFLIIGVGVLCEAGCSTARDRLEHGDRFFQAGKYEDAEIQYRKALQKNPNLGEAYYGIGLVKIEQHKGAEAYQPLFRAVQLMPDSDDAKRKLADVTFALYALAPHRPKAAYDQVDSLADQLLAKNQNSIDGLRLKGSLRLLDRNPKAAIVLFEKANQVEPMRPDVVEGLVQALFQDSRVADAERLALQMIQKDKTSGSTYDILYRQYVSTSRPADAENILKTKIANNPTEAAYLLQLARHYASARNSAEMNSTLQRLLNNPKGLSEVRLQVGDFYGSIGQWDQALQQFEEGARGNPKEKLIYQKRMTDALLALRKNTEAAQIVDLILKEQPKDGDARRVRAKLLLETYGPENVAKAVAELQALVNDQPNDVRVRFILGRAYLAQPNLEAARGEFQQVVRLRNDDLPSRLALTVISLSQRKPAEALKYADEILSRDPENDAAKLLRAAAMTGAGYYGAARAELARLLRQNPKSQDVQFQLGMLAIAEKKFSEAEGIFRKLYQPGQGDPRPAEGLVETYSAQNQFETALQLLQEDLKKSPDSLPLRRLLAITAMRARKYDLAIAEFRRLLEKVPKSGELHLQLGEAYHLKGDLGNAINVAEQAHKLAPNDPEPIMFLGAMLETAGRSAEAKAKYQRVLELRPDNPFVLNNIAFSLAQTGGDLDEALRLARRALQKAPGHPTLTDTLGWIYLKKGMTDTAVQTFSNLVRQQPQDPTFRYHLGIAFLEKGEKAKAKHEFESALSNQPSPADELKLRELIRNIG